MSVDGLWTVTFAASESEAENLIVSEEINRGGVFVLRDGRMYGGGISYYFVGAYQTRDDQVELSVLATRYNNLVSGVFNDLPEARFILHGKVEGEIVKLHGHMEGSPERRMIIKAQRRCALD